MANKITTNVYDAIGNTYAMDVYVTHPSNRCNIQDLDDKGLVVLGLNFYRSQADKEANMQPFKPVNSHADKQPINDVLHVDGITNRTKVFEDCQTKTTAYLKSIYGNENVIEC